ncbi:hypothetical protein [Pseudomonas sp. S3E12]|uniref:hypothetical protein n=1 Tax=Pseudomonas sp. S3E12 TaxID=1873126 RepID=UPI00081BE421|nr:hypothetical protein [Pseudomonas sp. S3E12]OCW21905.1 hypothetical protein BB029_19700 [Pseudomonas sp. S3E12]
MKKVLKALKTLFIISDFDFDFYNLSLVLGLSVQRENGGQIIDTYKVDLEMLYESEQSAFEVVLGFTGVHC